MGDDQGRDPPLIAVPMVVADAAHTGPREALSPVTQVGHCGNSDVPVNTTPEQTSGDVPAHTEAPGNVLSITEQCPVTENIMLQGPGPKDSYMPVETDNTATDGSHVHMEFASGGPLATLTAQSVCPTHVASVSTGLDLRSLQKQAPEHGSSPRCL